VAAELVGCPPFLGSQALREEQKWGQFELLLVVIRIMRQENQKFLISFPIAGFMKPGSVKRSG
jgi:hypothetical protein